MSSLIILYPWNTVVTKVRLALFVCAKSPNEIKKLEIKSVSVFFTAVYFGRCKINEIDQWIFGKLVEGYNFTLNVAKLRLSVEIMQEYFSAQFSNYPELIKHSVGMRGIANFRSEVLARPVFIMFSVAPEAALANVINNPFVSYPYLRPVLSIALCKLIQGIGC